MGHLQSDGANLDERAIKSLVHRYNALIDAEDFVAWANCFTETGILHGAYADWVVRQELDRFIEFVADRKRGAAPFSRHFVTNLEITFGPSPNNATARSYVTVTAIVDGRPNLTFTGTHQDSLEKHGDRWLIAEHRVGVDGRRNPT